MSVNCWSSYSQPNVSICEVNCLHDFCENLQNENQDLDTSKPLWGIFFWNTQKGWVVGEDRTIFTTKDGGQHWQLQYSHQSLLWSYIFSDVLFLTESKGFVVGGGNIYYTVDGGKVWIRIPDTKSPSRIAFANDTNGWAVSSRRELSWVTTVGGIKSTSENVCNQIFGIFTLGGAAIMALPLIIYYQKRKKNRILFQGKKELSILNTARKGKTCPVCGTSIPVGSNFCITCGLKLK